MKKNYLKALFWVIQIQWQVSRLSFGWSVFNSVISGLMPIAQAYILAKLIASVSEVALQQANPEPVYLWLVALLAVETIAQLIKNLDELVSHRLRHKMELAINEQFFRKMYELSQEQFDNEEFNTKLERARGSLIQISWVFQEVFDTISMFIRVAGSIAAIVIISPIIGGLIILSVVPVSLLLFKKNTLQEAVYKKSEPFDRVAHRSRWILVDPNFMPEIRLMNAFKKLVTTWRVNMQKSQDLVYANYKYSAKIETATETVQPLVSFGATIYFFQLLLAGAIGLDRFIFLRGMLEQSSTGAIQLAMSLQRLHELSIGLDNFSKIYDAPPVIPNGHVKINRPLTIEFKKVSFSYPRMNQNVIDDVSFTVLPGSKLALVGENGAGKTTLIKLLLRQYLPTKGTITVNDVDIRDIDQETYYSAISNLSQELLVVQHLSIKDNLVIGLNREPSDEEIYKVTDLVDATGFIKQLPHKLNTRLDPSFDDGTNLSGGQKQRIGVARALLRNGDFMILDEPTSVIDAKAEYKIFNNIYKSHAGKTTLIVSHRFSTVRKADSILVLENGKITESGSHEELLRQNGLYKEMFEAQAEGYK